jgi:hypothetical protein
MYIGHSQSAFCDSIGIEWAMGRHTDLLMCVCPVELISDSLRWNSETLNSTIGVWGKGQEAAAPSGSELADFGSEEAVFRRHYKPLPKDEDQIIGLIG